jgi:two-component system sensor histidine kinase QseC
MSVVGTASYSLRRRLLWLLLTTIALSWLATVGAVFLRAHDMADELFDAQLVQMAKSLLATIAARPGDTPPTLEAAAYGHTQELVFQVWRVRAGHASLLMRSADAPLAPLTETDGFSEHDWGKQLWRFYSRHEQLDDGSDYEVHLGQQHAVRYALAEDATSHILIPLLAGMPLLALAIWFAVGRALRPLRAVTEAVETRRPEALDALAVAQAPQEVQPLIEALNELFSRIRHTLDSERQFTANAAHELRTPLAALKTQAQVALRADTDSSRQRALGHVVEGVDRMTRLTEQLLTLARLDPENMARKHWPVELTALAIQAIGLLDAATRAKNIHVSIAATRKTSVEGNADLLQVLLRNLLDNAIRYTPQGGTITLSIQRKENAIELAVADSGPGIPEAERERAVRRFERLGNSRSEGSGLGLSIVARIAELHGARLLLEQSDAGGLRATVRFGA